MPKSALSSGIKDLSFLSAEMVNAASTITINYDLPDDSTVYDLTITCSSSILDLLNELPRVHQRDDLLKCMIDDKPNPVSVDEILANIYHPTARFHFSTWKQRFRYDSLKPPLGRVLLLTRTFLVRELCQQAAVSDCLVEICGEVCDGDQLLFACLSKLPTDFWLPVSFRVPPSPDESFHIVTLSGHGISNKPVQMDLTSTLTTLQKSDLKNPIVSGFQSVGLDVGRNSLTVYIFLPNGQLFLDGQVGAAFSDGSMERILYFVGFGQRVDPNLPIRDPGLVSDPSFPKLAFLHSEDSLTHFSALTSYIHRRGFGSADLLDPIARFVPFPPFVSSFTKLVKREPMSQMDVALLLHTFPVLVRMANDTIRPERLMQTAGFVFSNLILPFPTAVDAPSGGPFDPIPPSSAIHRRTLSIVQSPSSGGYQYLSIGKAPKETDSWGDDIDQLNLVMIDDSATMRTLTPEPANQKIEIARKLAQTVFDGFRTFAPRSMYGFTVFSQADTFTLTSVPPEVPTIKTGMSSVIWRAIAAAAGKLAGNFRKRILVITDGEDYSGVPPSQDLVSQNVVIDAIFLPGCEASNPEFEKELRGICTATKGCFLSLSNQGPIIVSEQFLDLSLRDFGKILAQSILFRIPFSRTDSLSSLGIMQIEHQNSHNFRMRRILAEMAICRSLKIHVFAVNKCMNNWRVFLPGKGNVLWDLAISFGMDYPYRCPVFRFLSVPKMDGVKETGRVAIPEYHPAMQIATLLGKLQPELAKAELPADYQKLIADKKTEKWLPIPSIGYLTNVSREPDMVEGTEIGKVDPTVEFSDVTWRPIEPGKAIIKCGVRIRHDEEDLISGSDLVGS
jgi:ubiquitin-protein ligase